MMMETKEYIRRVETDLFSLMQGNNKTATQEYFYGHLPRFEAQVEMFRKHLDNKDIGRVYDIGTGTPFVSYYFNLTQGAEVEYGCPIPKAEKINKKVVYSPINLCTPDQGAKKADLVICTECIEHLPCPLPPVIEYLKSIVKKDKYLLLSFPYGKIRGEFIQDYGSHEVISDDHIREFSPVLVDKFLDMIGWEIVDRKETYTQAYSGDIVNVLLKNKG